MADETKYIITADNSKLMSALKAQNELVLKSDKYMQELGTTIDATLSKNVKQNASISKPISDLIAKINLLKKSQNELSKLPDGSKARVEGLKRVEAEMIKASAQLDKYGAAIKKYTETQQKTSSNDFFKRSVSGITKTSDEIVKLNQHYKELEKSSIKTAEAQQRTSGKQLQGQFKEHIQSLTRTSDEVKRLNQHYKELEKSSAKAATIQSKLGKKGTTELLSFNPKNINQASAAIQELTNRRNNLDRADKNYLTTLGKINQRQAELIAQNQKAASVGLKRAASVNTVNKSLLDQSRIMDQLYRQASIYFSIFQAKRLVSEMVKVRGEFELQNVALSAMLQNKELANEMFLEVQEMALKSPFKILELNKYLKQLKAYRIENEDLVDTLGMLGDVSAGVGVSMDRLILAYGQVRAASVLRGTELRQFTEAGIPLVDQLADKFTELNGRVTSTAEVFDLISKRQVSFEMVRDIFADMTKEGGIFFEQQKLQSETLSGQLSVLRDAFDKMLNEMGKSNQGVLSGAISAARALVDNYEKVIASLKVMVVVYGQWRALSMVNNILSTAEALRKMKTATDAAAKSQAALNLKLLKNPYVAAAAAITTVIVAIRQYIKMQDKANAARLESIRPLKQESLRLRELGESYSSNATSNERRLEILQEIKKISPELVEGYENERKAIDELTNAIERQSQLKSDIATIKGASEEYDDYIKAKQGLEEWESSLDKITPKIKDLYKDVAFEISRADEGLPYIDILNEIINSDQSEGEKIQQFVDARYQIRNEIRNAINRSDDPELIKELKSAQKVYEDIFAELSRGDNGVAFVFNYKANEVAIDKAEEQLELKLKTLREKLYKLAVLEVPEGGQGLIDYLKRLYVELGLTEDVVQSATDAIGREWIEMTKSIQGIDFSKGITLPSKSQEYLDYIKSIQEAWQDAKKDLDLYSSKNVELTALQTTVGRELTQAEKEKLNSLKKEKDEIEGLISSYYKILDFWDAFPKEAKNGFTLLPYQKTQVDALKNALKLIKELRDARVKLDTATGDEGVLRADEKEAYETLFNEAEIKSRFKKLGLGQDFVDELFKEFGDARYDEVLDKFLRKFSKEITKIGGRTGQEWAKNTILGMSEEVEGLKVENPLDEAVEDFEERLKNLKLGRDWFNQIIPEGAEKVDFEIQVINKKALDDVSDLAAEYQAIINEADKEIESQRKNNNQTEVERIEREKKAYTALYNSRVREIKQTAEESVTALVDDDVKERLGNLSQFYTNINDASFFQITRVTKALDILAEKSAIEFISQGEIDRLQTTRENIETIIDLIESGSTEAELLEYGFDEDDIEYAQQAIDSQDAFNKKVDETKKKWKDLAFKEQLERISDGVNQISGDMIGLGDAIGQTNTELGDTISGMAELAQAAANITLGILSGNPLQVASSIIGLVTSLISKEAEEFRAWEEAQQSFTASINEAVISYKTYLNEVVLQTKYITTELNNLTKIQNEVFDVANPYSEAISGANAYRSAMKSLNETMITHTQVSRDSFNFGQAYLTGLSTISGPIAVAATVNKFKEANTEINSLRLNIKQSLEQLGRVQVGSEKYGGFLGIGQKTRATYGSLTEFLGVAEIDLLSEDQLNKALSVYDLLDEKTKQVVDSWKTYQEQAKESIEQVNEALNSLVGNLGTDFMDAIVDGFVNMTDASDAFRDSVEGSVESMIEQLILSTTIAPLLQELQADMYRSFGLNADETPNQTAIFGREGFDRNIADDVGKWFQEEGNTINDVIEDTNRWMRDIQDTFSDYGLNLWDPSDTGSQRSLGEGIKSVTEDTANLLASYMNTIRYEVVQHTTYLNSMVSILQNSQAVASDQLTELVNISNNTARIAEILEDAQNGVTPLKVE